MAEDIIDTRDLIQRRAEIEEELRTGADDPELSAELAEIEEIEGYAEDFAYGATLIADSYFTEYAQQFAEDIGAVASDAQWPLYCIDWERAARDLQMDYSRVTYRGEEYWTQ